MMHARIPTAGLALGLGAAVVLGGCGDKAGGGTADAPPVDAAMLPRVPLAAHQRQGNGMYEARPIDVSCLGTPSEDRASTVAITLSTTIVDFQDGLGIAGAVVRVFDGTNFGSPVVMGTASSAAGMQGEIELAIPAGRRRIGFHMSAPDWYDTLLVNQYLQPDMPTQSRPSEIPVVSMVTGSALPAFVGETRTAGTGILAGSIRDCAGNTVSNFTATVSSAAGVKMPLAGARTFYFGDNGFPARNNVEPVGNVNGLFLILELPPTAVAYVQSWGFLNQADADAGRESLLSEVAVPVVADLVITGTYAPRRTGP